MSRPIAPALVDFLTDPDAYGGVPRLESARKELRALLAVARVAQTYGAECNCTDPGCVFRELHKAVARLRRASGGTR